MSTSHQATERTYLEEDILQIQRYFPGARPVALRTPFDLSEPLTPPSPYQSGLCSHSLNGPTVSGRPTARFTAYPQGGLLWTH